MCSRLCLMFKHKERTYVYMYIVPRTQGSLGRIHKHIKMALISCLPYHTIFKKNYPECNSFCWYQRCFAISNPVDPSLISSDSTFHLTQWSVIYLLLWKNGSQWLETIFSQFFLASRAPSVFVIDDTRSGSSVYFGEPRAHLYAGVLASHLYLLLSFTWHLQLDV